MCECVCELDEHVTWQADRSNRTAAIDRSVLLGANRSVSNAGVPEGTCIEREGTEVGYVITL